MDCLRRGETEFLLDDPEVRYMKKKEYHHWRRVYTPSHWTEDAWTITRAGRFP